MVIIENDALIRETPIYLDSETITGVTRECIITKQEFIACYYKWIKHNPDLPDIS